MTRRPLADPADPADPIGSLRSEELLAHVGDDVEHLDRAPLLLGVRQRFGPRIPLRVALVQVLADSLAIPVGSNPEELSMIDGPLHGVGDREGEPIAERAEALFIHLE